MKQQVVIKLPMNNHKSGPNWSLRWFPCMHDSTSSNCKALQIAVGVRGVEKAGLKGTEKDELEVVGDDGFDAVKLTRLLRKNLGTAQLVSLGEKKDDAPPAPEDKDKDKVQPPVFPPYHYGHPFYYEVEYPSHSSYCSIL